MRPELSADRDGGSLPSCSSTGVVYRVIGVHGVVTGIEESRAMKILAAGLGHRSDHRRTLLVRSVEIRHLHLDLGDHVGVGIHRRIAVTSRVGHVRAIRGDVQGVGGQTVIGVSPVQRALAAGIAVTINANGLAVVVGSVVEKNRNLGDFFMFFRPENFFSKMTLLGLILCGESIVRIPKLENAFLMRAFPKLENASLTLIQGNGVCVLKRKSKF